MTTCPSCAAENVGGGQFCTRCGTTLSRPQWAASSGALRSDQGAKFQTGQAAESLDIGHGHRSGFDYSPPSSYQPGVALYNAQPIPAGQQSQTGMKADPMMRLVSWVIDMLLLLVCLVPIIIFGFVPFIGLIIVWLGIPLIAVTYHLMRDITGASPGKSLLGMKVMSRDGPEAPNGSRVLRNVLFAIPPVFMILPIIGHVIGGLLGFALVVTELIMLLSTGERIGDRIANTVVLKTR